MEYNTDYLNATHYIDIYCEKHISLHKRVGLEYTKYTRRDEYYYDKYEIYYNLDFSVENLIKINIYNIFHKIHSSILNNYTKLSKRDVYNLVHHKHKACKYNRAKYVQFVAVKSCGVFIY